jgi:hypothetical protein
MATFNAKSKMACAPAPAQNVMNSLLSGMLAMFTKPSAKYETERFKSTDVILLDGAHSFGNAAM